MPATGQRPKELYVRCGLAAFGGLLFGVSAFWSGFYDTALWSPASLVFLTIALTFVIAVRRLPSGTALALVGGLAGLWLWSLLSSGWADRADLALVAANRWALYTAVAITLVLLVDRDRRVALVLLGACSAAALAFAGYVLVRMLLPSAQELFLATNLNQPIGYVNAEANLLLLGFWPLVAVAAHTRRRLPAALAIAGATALGALLLADERRGTVVALALSGLVLFALVPGRRTRLWVVLAVAAGVALAAHWIAPIYQHPDPATGVATLHDIHQAALAALLAGAGVGCVWAVLLSCGAAARGRVDGADRRLAQASTAALAGLALAAAVAVGLNAGSIEHRIRDQYNAFIHLSPSPQSFRLFSGGGNRYDYWRVAWKEFEQEPLRGVGAGSYTVGYFRDRRTAEDITQPHSIELQTLAELGLVGGLALALFLGAPVLGLWRWSRRAKAPGIERLVAVGAGGLFLSWLGQTSVDWIHLFPGITALALGAAVVLVSPTGDAPSPADGPKRRALPAWASAGRLGRLLRAIVVAAIVVAALLTARTMVADHLRADARALLARDPVAALAKTNDALALEGDSVDTYYVRAAALARLDLYPDARAALERAIANGPEDWVSWGLLGDLALRHGDDAAAAAAYRHAVRLNPMVAVDLPVVVAKKVRTARR